jgi:hypothetical protein
MPLEWREETEGRFMRTDPTLAPRGGYSGNVRLFIIYPDRYKGNRMNYAMTSKCFMAGRPQFSENEAELRTKAEEIFQNFLRRARLSEGTS